MTSSPQLVYQLEESLMLEFFQQTAGNWRSERRYYTLPDGDTQEVISLITIKFLAQGCSELIHLAQLHELSDAAAIICGSYVTWQSTDVNSGQQVSEGATIFGISQNTMYRDRGYATLKPVVAEFRAPNSQTLQLRTEYNRCVFEEEIKLIGSQYRTRQTIVTKAGQQQLIGQYLETRLS